MANFFSDNDDLRFYFDKGVDWRPIVELVEQDCRLKDGHASVEEAVAFYREVAETIGRFSAEEIAPRVAEIDRLGVEFVDGDVVFSKPLQTIFKKLGNLGLHGLCLPRELGGLNAPMTVYMLCNELLSRADAAVMSHHGFHGGIAIALLYYSMLEGSTEFDPDTLEMKSCRFERQIREIVDGKAWGSMDLTEPGAGSDLAQIRTKAELDEDGIWRVSGEKIFITSGHAKHHIVLARTEPSPEDADDPMAGLGGLSLFLVEAYQTKRKKKIFTAKLERIEEKLGHHASATVALSFDRCKGELIGRRGEGFKLMLLIMNNARIAVGFESVGLCEAALRMSREYAAERVTMGKPIDQHEIVADYLDEMQTDTQGLRALSVQAAIYEETAQRYRIAASRQHAPGSDEALHAQSEAKRYTRKSRRLTPLVKFHGAEKAVEITRRCVQIHGGVGYTTEYGCEKLLRDALLLPIYEGTSQIQALMVVKDALGGIIKRPRSFVARMAQARWRVVSARDALDKRVARLQGISYQALQHLMQRTAKDKFKALGGAPLSSWPERFFKNWDPKRDFAFAMLHAERLTRILTDVAIAEVLWKQAARFPERRELLERHLERAEPRCRFELDCIMTTGDRLLGRLRGDQEISEAR